MKDPRTIMDENVITIVAAHLPGLMGMNSANGANRRYLTHAVEVVDGRRLKAACNASPGYRSNGWYSTPGETITCQRCLKKIAGMSDALKELGRDEFRHGW
jgi:hypothetical protein